MKPLHCMCFLLFDCLAFAAPILPVTKDAIYKLIEIENRRSHDDPLLNEALKSSNSDIVIQSLRSIARIGHSALAKDVALLLNHPDKAVRLEAAFALGQLKGAISENALIASVGNEFDGHVRGALYKSLGQSGSENSYRILSHAVEREVSVSALVGLTQGLENRS